MRSLVTLLKNTNTGRLVKRNRYLKRLIKGIYKFFMFPFTRKGVSIKIGGIAEYKLDYQFALREYETFGAGHNAGFREWIECCRNKRTVVDVGAHIGLYTLPASGVISRRGTVYALEPSEANRRYLERHLAYNGIGNVLLFPFLVGSRTAESQEFYENKMTDPMNSLHPKKNRDLYDRVYRKQVTLDDFCAKEGILPDVIKIDVEGAECEVLSGAREIIKKAKPCVFMSAHPEQLPLFDSSIDKLEGIIGSLGYIAHSFGSKDYMLTPAGREQ